MKLSPLHIKQQEFNKSFRGYDADEVTAFLERIAAELEELQQEYEKMKEELQHAKNELAEFHRIEKNLQDTLLKTTESANKAIESTRKQATLMLKEAEVKAQQILDKAKEQADETRASVIALREERDLLLARLRAMVNSQANILETVLERPGTGSVNSAPEEPEKKFQINIDQVVEKLL